MDKIRVTDLMLNSQKGYEIINNDTKYMITLDYSGDSVLLGTSSLTFYINRKKFCIITLNNLVLTYKREVNDLINTEPKLFSLCIDTFDTIIDNNKIDDSRIDQRMLLFIYIMGDLSYLANQGNLTRVSIDKVQIYRAMQRLKNNLTISGYKMQVHTRILNDFLDKTKDQFIPNDNNNDNVVNDKPNSENIANDKPNSENIANETSVKRWSKVELESLLNKSIKRVGKYFYVDGDNSQYHNFNDIAKTYELIA